MYIHVHIHTCTVLLFRLHAGEDKQDGTEGEGEGEGEGEEGRNRGIVVTFEVREKGWFKTSVGANVGTQSGDAVCSVSELSAQCCSTIPFAVYMTLYMSVLKHNI